MEVYVSPTGDDDNSGSFSSPVKTIEKARDIIRLARKNSDVASSAKIVLREGTYSADDTITFTSLDSGSEIYPLEITAYNNENARISGGVDIGASQLQNASAEVKNRIIDTSARANIKAINLYDLGISQIDLGEISRRGHSISENKKAQAEVSVDGKRLCLAGWPNENFVGLNTVISYGSRRNPTTGDGGVNITNGCAFTYSGYNRPALWAEPDKAWISGVLGPNYAYDYYPVESVENNTITLREGAIVDYYSKQFFRFENILEELDMPGEYYIDRDNGMLYIYMPEGSTASSRITVSVSDKNIIKLQDANNICFKGLEIESGRESGIVTSGNCYGIAVEDCKIHSFGANGIALHKCKFSRVSGSDIYDVGKNAISVTGGDFANIISAGNVIYNNNIYRFSQLERSYTAGVYIGYQSVGTKVKNNHIYDAPHAGIIFYGVNNEISYNEIDNVVNEFHDMDAVYVNNYDMPWERGNIIEHNYFHDIGRQYLDGTKQMNVAAIRTDNNGHGLRVRSNIFYNIGRENTNNVSGVQAQGTHNIIEGNIFIDCSEAYCGATQYNAGAQYSETVSYRSAMNSYIAGLYGTIFPEITTFWSEHPQKSKTNVFKNNVVVNIAFPLSTINNNANSWQNTDGEGYRGARETIDASGNFVSTTDVGFVDYENGNFNLNRNSEVFSEISGFNGICMDAIGKR